MSTAAKVVHPPDGGWGWMVVVGVFLQGFFSWGILTCYPLLYQPLMDEFNVGLGQVTWINGANEIGRALGYLSMPALSTRFGYRVPCMVLSAVSGISIALASFSPSDILIYILVGFIPGFALGNLNVPTYIMVFRYFDKRRLIALGITQTGSPLGTLVLAPVFQIFLNFYGLRGSLLIAGGLSLNCVVAASLYRPILLHSDVEEKTKTINNASGTKIKILLMPYFWVIVLILIGTFGGIRLYMSFLPPFAVSFLGIDKILASLLLSITTTVSIGWRVVVGALCRKLNVTWFNFLSLLMSAIVTTSAWFAKSYTWLAITAVLFSLASSSGHVVTMPLLSTAIGETNLEMGISLSGFIYTMLAFGIVPATGLVIDIFNDMRIGFLSSGAFFVFAALLHIVLLRKQHVDKRVDEKPSSKDICEESNQIL